MSTRSTFLRALLPKMLLWSFIRIVRFIIDSVVYADETWLDDLWAPTLHYLGFELSSASLFSRSDQYPAMATANLSSSLRNPCCFWRHRLADGLATTKESF